MRPHTPGPWNLFTRGDALYIKPADAPEEHPSGVYNFLVRLLFRGQLSDRDRANARLIAAAPELLEALEQIYARLAPWQGPIPTGVPNNLDALCMDVNHVVHDIRAAIAKAKGE